MNILILNWKDIRNPKAGGAEIITFEFAKRLSEEGHSVTIFSRSYKGCKKEEIIDDVNIIRRGNLLTVYAHAFLYYKSLSEKPDRVIDMVNTLCWQTPLYVPRSKRIAYVNQLAREVLFYELPFPLSVVSYLLEPLEFQTYRNTRVICYSKSTKNDLISLGLPGGNISVFPMGLDHSRYFPCGKKSEYPHFIFVARLVRMKRADVCIEAISEVVKKYPEVKLDIIGNGPEEKNLQTLINDHNLKDNVSLVTSDNFYVKKNNKDMKVKLMRQAWALLLPSVKEGWGMVVTEAAACGTPAIVSDVTGLKDSVKNDITGIITSRKPTSSEIANAMVRIIESKSLLNQLAKESIRWSREFNWDLSYRKFKKLVTMNYDQ